MDKTPTLTKNQQKATLSAKKSKNKESIRNVVSQPFNNFYWPLLSETDNKIIDSILKKCLPKIQADKINIPWKEIKDVPKEERKQFRKRYSNEEIDKNESKNWVFGINSVSKLLEERKVSTILIASDVRPRLLVQHVLDLSVLYKVPVVVVKDLRNVLKLCCGISSLIIGITNNIEPSSKVEELYRFVQNIYHKYPVPEDHINYNRSFDQLRYFEPSKDEVPKINEEKTTNTLQKVISAQYESDIIKFNHLERSSKNERAFVPKYSTKSVFEVDNNSSKNNFISLTTETCVSFEAAPKSYKSLSVKRLKGDSNRNKRKINELKK